MPRGLRRRATARPPPARVRSSRRTGAGAGRGVHAGRPPRARLGHRLPRRDANRRRPRRRGPQAARAGRPADRDGSWLRLPPGPGAAAAAPCRQTAPPCGQTARRVVTPRSLGGRLAASFILLALAVLLAVGGTLFLVLRALHADATTGSLGDLSGSLLPQVRQSVGGGNLRGTIEDIRDGLAERGIEVIVVGADGALRPIGGEPVGGTIPLGNAAPGESVHGAVQIGDQSWLYVATVLRRTVAAAPKAVAFLAPDRSAALALADLGRAIPAVALVLLIVGVPLAWLVARSVTRPLGRLA